jgi:biopolymer transport protein ExbD
MALGQYTKRSRKFAPPGLMLTSMMDMFTIILIFLIFSFSENPEQHQLSKELELPNSTAKIETKKAVEIILAKNELRLNDELMATINNRQTKEFLEGDLKSTTLFRRLKTLRGQVEARNGDQEARTEQEQTPHILFLCDKSHSFKTINRVIKTAGMAGYPNFQFAVLEGK